MTGLILTVLLSLTATPARGGGIETRRRPSNEVEVVRDVQYGSHPAQRFDVYTAKTNRVKRPVIFMVHGGGWQRGDKAMASVVQAKVRRWVPSSAVLISTNYRMLPDADPREQARDVALALAHARKNAEKWGGDPSRFILMGHSAGAHLAALLATSETVREGLDLPAPIAVVLLDGAALDVVAMMKQPHARLFDRAFGNDPRFWQAVSPFHHVSRGDPPLLIVCSSLRANSCAQARSFAAKAGSVGVRAEVLPQPLSHRDVNATLGEGNAYTTAVENFIGLRVTVASAGWATLHPSRVGAEPLQPMRQ